MTVTEFQDKYATKEEKIEAAKKMSDSEIDEIIDSCDNTHGKIFYSRLKKMNQIARYSEKYNDLTASVMRYFSNDMTDNMVFSPFSIIMLLSIVADAVDGKTRQEVLDVLGSDLEFEDYRSMISMLQSVFTDEVTHDLGENEYKTGGNIVSSNAVCIQEKIKKSITSGYEDRLAKYRGRLFASKDIVKDVNAWVKENTKGMISEVADESMSQMLACLMNAIAFEADWAKKYDEDDIYEDDFTNADGSVSEVQMMDSTEHTYIENDFYTGFVKPYKGLEYSYMALLPKKKSPSFVKRSLKSIDFTKLLHESIDTKVYVTMPEFKYDFGKELTNLFQNMGVETLFSPQADFSPMSSEWLKMESIIHKAHIEVDRKGTKAAAVTMGIVCAGCAPIMEESKTVCLNRPFVYAIVHNETGLPVFAGIMNHAVENV